MAANTLASLKVLAFDVFGTVVDWRSGIIGEVTDVAKVHSLSVDPAEIADAWRRRYPPWLDRVRRGELPWQNLDELHRAMLAEVVTEFSLQPLTDADRNRLVFAWHRLPPWPDAVDGLTRLRAPFILSTLSNGGMAQLVDLARTGRLPFDCILSTELAKTYKPDPAVYQLVPSLLAVRADQALMVAAHANDLEAAAGQGMRTAFVRRPQEWGTGKAEIPDFPVDIVAEDFLDLASQLGA